MVKYRIQIQLCSQGGFDTIPDFLFLPHLASDFTLKNGIHRSLGIELDLKNENHKNHDFTAEFKSASLDNHPLEKWGLIPP
jgi:hypothetical protein